MSIPTEREDAPELDDEEREEEEGGQRLDVYLKAGVVADVKLNGESVWPIWFKVEWKGNGQVSAKVRGVRLSTSMGDEIQIHQVAR